MPGLSSSFGFTTACAALATGRALAFAESPFQAIRMIELFSIDFVMASTEQVLALTRVAKKTGAHLPSLRTVEFAGSVATKPLIEAAALYLCRDLLCRYGASETGVMARVPAREMLAHPGFVGEVVPEVEIMIVGRDGRPCAVGEVGRVRARMGAKAKDDPWIDLGDIGRLDADGRLFIFGRAADASDATGALTLDTTPVEEIEHLVRLEWDMADAAAALVKGQAGLRPNLCIGVVQGSNVTTESVRSFLQKQGIDYPVRVITLDAIPRGANGKVNRERLKAALQANLS
jgi:long-chain acyl-CoA synthetase